jgi:hypothetical protein
MQQTIGEFLHPHVEPWMDLLMVGLSPEVLMECSSPSHLVTVRLGSSPPREPWDAAFIRLEAAREEACRRTVERVTPDLRHGGRLGLITAVASELDVDLAARLTEGQPLGDPEITILDDEHAVALFRKAVPGAQDLVGLRRCIRQLESDVDRLETLLADVRDRDASTRTTAEGWTLKELVGHLGDQDRDGYLAAIRHLLTTAGAPIPAFDAQNLISERAHNGRLLAELVVRFRHFRYQALELLESLREADWLRSGTAPDGTPVTVAGLLRTWVRKEQEGFETLESLLS